MLAAFNITLRNLGPGIAHGKFECRQHLHVWNYTHQTQIYIQVFWKAFSVIFGAFSGSGWKYTYTFIKKLIKVKKEKKKERSKFLVSSPVLWNTINLN